MSNTTRTAIFAAIIAAVAPGAYAQTSTIPAARTAVPSHIIQSDEVRASKMIGSTVYDLQNRNIGKVSDLVLNKDGAFDVVVLEEALSRYGRPDIFNTDQGSQFTSDDFTGTLRTTGS